MTLDEALKKIEILKIQNKKLVEAFDSLDKKYDLLKLELELAQACHNEKCAEFNKLCFDHAKLQVKNEKFERNMKSVLEIEKKNAAKEGATKFAEKLKQFYGGVEVSVYNGSEEGVYELNDKIDELLEDFLK